LIVLCGMGVHSALGPSKYGILPELIPHDVLPRQRPIGDVTFAAILTGTAAGGFLFRPP
jgi:hypothetical protein